MSTKALLIGLMVIVGVASGGGVFGAGEAREDGNHPDQSVDAMQSAADQGRVLHDRNESRGQGGNGKSAESGVGADGN